MKKLNSSLKIGKYRVKNRLVVPPMASQTADSNGFVTSKTLNHYKRLAQAKAGLIFVEYTYVDLSGRSEPNQLGADSQEKLLGLKKLVQVIKDSGALAGLQLTHAGGKGSRKVSDGTLPSPSGLKVPTYKSELETPDIVDLKKIPALINSFVAGANLAWQAGFEIVELHAAHTTGAKVIQ